MYAKVFTSIYDGTLADHWQALVTFQQLLILSDAQGVVDMSPCAIARRTGIPLAVIEEGLDVLARPDIASRSTAMEGRRIALLDNHREWGWFIVNHAAYRGLVTAEDKREIDRKRIALKRADIRSEKSQHVASGSKVLHAVANVAHTDAEGREAVSEEANASTSSASSVADPAADPPIEKKSPKLEPMLRLAQVTDEATQAYNVICAKPHGLMPKAKPAARQARQQNVRRVVGLARSICADEYGGNAITPQFWIDYFTALQADDFHSGRQGGGKGHEGWTPDFEYVTRLNTMLRVYERAGKEV